MRALRRVRSPRRLSGLFLEDGRGDPRYSAAPASDPGKIGRRALPAAIVNDRFQDAREAIASLVSGVGEGMRSRCPPPTPPFESFESPSGGESESIGEKGVENIPAPEASVSERISLLPVLFYLRLFDFLRRLFGVEQPAGERARSGEKAHRLRPALLLFSSRRRASAWPGRGWRGRRRRASGRTGRCICSGGSRGGRRCDPGALCSWCAFRPSGSTG